MKTGHGIIVHFEQERVLTYTIYNQRLGIIASNVRVTLDARPFARHASRHLYSLHFLGWRSGEEVSEAGIHFGN